MATIKGKVKWYDLRKGYGFITGEDGNDYFIHHSGINKGKHYSGFDGNDEVEFDVTDGKKGPQAIEVALVPKPKKEDAQKETE